MAQIELSEWTQTVANAIALNAGTPQVEAERFRELRQALPAENAREQVSKELIQLAARFVQEAPKSSLLVVLQLLELAVTVSPDAAEHALRFDLSAIRKAVGTEQVRDQLALNGGALAALGVKLISEV